MMQLYDNWKEILQRSWSLRFIILAGLFSGAEVIVPLFNGTLPLGTFATLNFIAVSGAFIARLVAQKGI